MHLKDTSESFLLILYRVVNSCTCVNSARIDTEEAYLTDKRVGSDLEGKSCEGLVVSGASVLRLLGIGVNTLDIGDVGRSRHEIDYGIKQGLNALVAVGSTAGDRDHIVGYGSLTDNGFDLLDSRLNAFKILLHELVVLLNDSFDKLLTVLCCKLLHVLRNFFAADILTEVVIIDLCVIVYKVNDSDKCVLRAYRQLNRNSIALESLLDHLENIVEISTHDIHFINVYHTGYMILVSLSPNGFRLRFNTALCTKNGNRTVKHAQ